jgi:hypothetical protein
MTEYAMTEDGEILPVYESWKDIWHCPEAEESRAVWREIRRFERAVGLEKYSIEYYLSPRNNKYYVTYRPTGHTFDDEDFYVAIIRLIQSLDMPEE